MHIERSRRRLQRRQPVVIVLRVEGLDMADDLGRIPMLLRTHHIVIGHRPAIRPGHKAHPVRAQHMQLRQPCTLRRHRLQIGVPRQHQLRISSLQQIGPPLRLIGPVQKPQHRMRVIAAGRVLTNHRQCGCRLRDQLDRPEPDRIALKPVLRQRDSVARAPGHPPSCAPDCHPRTGRGLALRHRHRGFSQEIQNHAPLSLSDT